MNKYKKYEELSFTDDYMFCMILRFFVKKRCYKQVHKFTQELKKAVNDAIANKKWEVDYMTYAMKIQEEREKARIFQLIETSKEFHANDNDIVIKLMSKFNLTREEAEEALANYEPEN